MEAERSPRADGRNERRNVGGDAGEEEFERRAVKVVGGGVNGGGGGCVGR